MLTYKPIQLDFCLSNAQTSIAVGDNSVSCSEDPNCINRLHWAIPMTSKVNTGDTIVFSNRNAADRDLNPEAQNNERDSNLFGCVHPLTGPVHIEGAEKGDIVKINIIDMIPGRGAWTITSGIVADAIEGFLYVH